MIKNIKNITREEFELMAKHHKMYTYNTETINEFFILVRTWVNPLISNCTTCQDTMREYKTQLNSFYLAHRDYMKQILDEKDKENVKSNQNATKEENNTEDKLQKAKKDVEEFISESESESKKKINIKNNGKNR